MIFLKILNKHLKNEKSDFFKEKIDFLFVKIFETNGALVKKRINFDDHQKII